MVLRPKPRNPRGDFEAQITKPELPVLRPNPGNPPPPWFWGSTKKPTTGVEAKPGETVTTSFEAKLEKTVAAGFEAKPLTKPSTLVLRLNQETHAPRLHVHGADRTWCHPTSHKNVLNFFIVNNIVFFINSIVFFIVNNILNFSSQPPVKMTNFILSLLMYPCTNHTLL
jgi:hypothetical protein